MGVKSVRGGSLRVFQRFLCDVMCSPCSMDAFRGDWEIMDEPTRRTVDLPPLSIQC